MDWGQTQRKQTEQLKLSPLPGTLPSSLSFFRLPSQNTHKQVQDL